MARWTVPLFVLGSLSVTAVASSPEPDTSGSDAGASAACAAEEARIERRKKWIRDRLEEQVARGMPNPKAGVPNMFALYCEEHPKDEQCTLGTPPIEFSPDELTWEAQKTPEDRDPHVIRMKRELADCRRRQR